MFGRVERVGLVVREACRPSSKYIGTRSSGQAGEDRRTVWPPMPLPASTTTLSGRMPVEVHEGAQVGRVLLQDVPLRVTVPRVARGGRSRSAARRVCGSPRARCPGRPVRRRRGTS